MFDIRKAGMLIILLALPAFFFLFLRGCTTNHYDLPYFNPLTDSNGRILVDGVDTIYYRVSGVLGVTPGGDTVTSLSLSEKISVFYLDKGGSEHEKSHLAEDRKRLLQLLEKEKDFQLLERVAESPRPDREPAVIRLYRLKDSDSWERILKTNQNHNLDGTLSQISSLVLVDPKGYIRGYYDLADTDDFERAVAEIKVLLYQKKLERE